MTVHSKIIKSMAGSDKQFSAKKSQEIFSIAYWAACDAVIAFGHKDYSVEFQSDEDMYVEYCDEYDHGMNPNYETMLDKSEAETTVSKL